MRSAFAVFLVLTALALLTPLGAALALAQAPSTMSYQGVLSDDLGNLVADGAYDLTFRIYDVSVGGVALWTEVDPGVAVVKGGFSVVLGLTTPINLVGLPSLALPCGFDSAGLPIGMQLIGRPFEEGQVLRAGRAYERVTDWHTRRPPL